MNPNKKQPVFDVPPEGALGLLALGATGVKAWKEAKQKHAALQKEKLKDDTADTKDNNIEKHPEQ